jgi:hypothetical protein
MRHLVAVALVLGIAGCVVTPYGAYIDPLPDVVVTGAPVVVAPPPSVVIQPLPPVYVVPDRRVYYYNNSYYYYWGDAWYWGRERKGPWHRLDRQYWPPQTQPRHDHGKGKGHYK